MPIKPVPTLTEFPTELIFCVFRYLDVATLVRSVRCVCKLFYTLVSRFSEYNFDFQSISKSNFLFVCNFVEKHNVLLLTLSDGPQTPGQIEYFLSLFRASHFPKLRTLKLLDIDSVHLNIMLKDIQKTRLKSLCIQCKTYDSQSFIDLNGFSSAMSLSSLRKLVWNIPNANILNLTWPPACTLQHLEITCVSFDIYCNILRELPNLQILVISNMIATNAEEIIYILPNMIITSKLLSLTFKYGNVDLNVLNLLLTLTPSITYLQLRRSVNLQAFVSYVPKMNELIEKHLIYLKTFEFFLVENVQLSESTSSPESVIATFQSPFWIDRKWSVICDYIMCPETIILYSSTFYDSEYQFIYESRHITRLASSTVKNSMTTMDGVRKLRLNLTGIIPFATSTVGGLTQNVMFPELDELTIHIAVQWPMGTLRFLTTLINMSRLVKISFEIDDSFNLNWESKIIIDSLLQLAPNLRALQIKTLCGDMHINDHDLTICSVVPKYVEHLKVSVSNIHQMRMVLNSLPHLTSIQFESPNFNHTLYGINKRTFLFEKGDYTYKQNLYSVSLWFDGNLKTTANP